MEGQCNQEIDQNTLIVICTILHARMSQKKGHYSIDARLKQPDTMPHTNVKSRFGKKQTVTTKPNLPTSKSTEGANSEPLIG